MPESDQRSNTRFIVILIIAAILVGGYFLIKNVNRPEPVMNVTYSTGPGEGGTGTRASATTRQGSDAKFEDIYAKAELRFTNKKVALKRPPKEIITELNHIGLSRDELLVSIADLLSSVGDDLKAKNMTTSFVASLGFQLTGGEYLNLLQAADIEDNFYYSSLIKATAEYARFPLTENQQKKICEPLSDSAYRLKCENVLTREGRRQVR